MRAGVQSRRCELALIGELGARGVRRQLEAPAACQMRCKRLCCVLRLSPRSAAARHSLLRHATLRRQHVTLKNPSKGSGADAGAHAMGPRGMGGYTLAGGWGSGCEGSVLTSRLHP